MPMDLEKIEAGFRMILEGIGEDPNREGLVKTPARVARMYKEMLAGMENDPAELLSTTFDEEAREMIIVRDIPIVSFCEHHFLPFIGKAHVAYIPNGKITGLSKIARVVETYARRLQVQERLTVQIRDCIQEALHPLGVAVVIEANHTCMQLRGVEKANAVTTTSAFAMSAILDESHINCHLTVLAPVSGSNVSLTR